MDNRPARVQTYRSSEGESLQDFTDKINSYAALQFDVVLNVEVEEQAAGDYLAYVEYYAEDKSDR